MPRGFILQPTYRQESGRPVVRLFGVLEGGGSFVVRDDRETPHFWVGSADAERARAAGAVVCGGPPNRADLDGRPVARVDAASPRELVGLGRRLETAGIETYEADVGFAQRYLIDRGIRGALEIRGPSRERSPRVRVFENPETLPADWTPELSLLSLDIETDPRASRLLSLALHGPHVAEVLLLTPEGASRPDGATPCRDEATLLRTFVRRVVEIDPDVLTGWNVIDFDLAVLERTARRLGVSLELGRDAGALTVQRSADGAGTSRARIPGRVVLDGIRLLRGAFVRMESYALDAVAHEVLGKGKTITGPDRAAEILDAFEHDRERLVEYNLHDARLVSEILDALHLPRLAVERSRLTGMPLDRVASSIASFDFLYLGELGRRRIVAPTVRPSDRFDSPTSGGHVLDPRPGLYRNVFVLDFKSLYPSIIRTFQIDPLGHVRQRTADDDVILAPNGAAFRREPGILPGLLDELFPRREAARAAGDRVASQAIKILMNSFYGVLGTPACRFASPALANAITGFGREILLWSRQRIEDCGHEVLYGDTDSLFVLAGEEQAARAREVGRRLVRRVNRELAEMIAGTWRVDSRLELEFERLYLRLLLPSVRHGRGGARKRYAGLVRDGDETRVVFTGMEVVRRDWTTLARRVQRELHERLFRDLPVAEYLRGVVADLRAGKLDEELVYRKTLRKRLADYEASAPHVVAARKLDGKPTRRIAYVITTDGPEPASRRGAPLDHEHYVQRQIRPVAEPVLAILGIEFDRVIGDDTQLSLF